MLCSVLLCCVVPLSLLAVTVLTSLHRAGNPGLIEYYDKFMSTLFEELGGKIPIWGISHGGHSLPDNVSSLPDLKGTSSVLPPLLFALLIKLSVCSTHKCMMSR